MICEDKIMNPNEIFERFSPLVQDFIYANGWKELRPIQIAAARVIFESDDNLILCSDTASGKTEAVFFPIVSELEESGCGIFVNSDKQSLFFTERFRVHGYYKGDYTTKYFDRWNDAVKFLQDWFPKARINCFNGIMEAKRKIEKAYRFNDKKPDYVCIDYFENDDEEEGGLAA